MEIRGQSLSVMTHAASGVLRGQQEIKTRHTIKVKLGLDGSDLSNGQAATTQHNLCLYLYTVKRGEIDNAVENARSQCFAENMEIKHSQSCLCCSKQRGTPRLNNSWTGLALVPKSSLTSSSAVAQALHTGWGLCVRLGMVRVLFWA